MAFIPQSYMQMAIAKESGGDPFARNPRSSARGLGQFTDATWNDLIRQRPDLGLTPDGRFDADQSKRAINAYAEGNANTLQNAGFEPTNDNLYMAHRFGPSGALRILGSPGDTSMATLFGPRVMAANPDLAGKTVNDLTGGGGRAMSFAPTAPAPTAPTQAPSATPSMPGVNEDTSNDRFNSVTNGVIGAGAALQSIDNPRGAAVLAGMMKQGQVKDDYSLTYDANSGTAFRINKRTGEVTSVRNDVPQKRTPWSDAQDKAFSDRYLGLIDSGEKARASLDAIGQMKQLVSNPNVYQGLGADQYLAARKLMSNFGFDTSGIADSELLRSMGNKLTLELKNFDGSNSMPGAMSDNDLKFLRGMSVDLSNAPSSNAKLLDYFGRVAKRRQDYSDWANEYVQANGKLDAGFYKFAKQRADAAPLFTDADNSQQAPTQSGNPQDAQSFKDKWGLK